MEVSAIISEIDSQISKLQQARELLLGSGTATKPGRGRPRKNAAPAEASTKTAGKVKRKTRNLSAEARKRIADAQKKRWAEKKKAEA